jgi:hypothetical protein
MREPLITDFLEHFLEEHHLTEKKPAPASRRNSVSSKRSSKSQTKASFRLSQAELLDYSNQQMTNITDISPSLSKRSSDDDTRLPYPLIHRLSTSTSTNVV